jgi:hypothetical protein
MTEVQRLTAALKAAKAATKAAKPAKNKRIPLEDRPTAPMTTGISMERRPESFEAHTNDKGKACKAWNTDHALLRFHGDDNKAHPIGSKLNLEDTVGLELVKSIKAYAKANRVGNSKVRFDPILGAWKGRADMFSPEHRKTAGYTLKVTE